MVTKNQRLLLNANRVISKERKPVRASKLIRAPDLPRQISVTSKVGYFFQAFQKRNIFLHFINDNT